MHSLRSCIGRRCAAAVDGERQDRLPRVVTLFLFADSCYDWMSRMLKQFASRLTLLACGLTFLLVVLAALRAAPAWAQEELPPFDAGQVTLPDAPPAALLGRSSYLSNCAPCHGELGRGDGPTAASLPGPATAFAERSAIWERSPAMLFYTTKFGWLDKLMPPWSNRLTDEEIWNTVAYAWSLHTSETEVETGAALYAASCAPCHGQQGAGDGPEAEGALPDFTDLSYTTFVSQAEWDAGWRRAHPDLGADWTQAQREATLEFIRTFSYAPPWVSLYQAGEGVITGAVRFAEGAPQPEDALQVALDAYLNFERVASFTTTLGVDNTFVFDGLDVNPELVYLATVVVDGFTYSSPLITLTPEQPQAAAPITVYGVTEDPSGVRLSRVHWIVDVRPGALLVAQIYLFRNDGDRAFVGRTVEGVETPVTVGVDVPLDAQEITLQGGALGGRFRRAGNIIYDTLPVMPGENAQQIIVQYALPVEGDGYTLAQELLYPTDLLSMLATNVPGVRIDAPTMSFDGVQTFEGVEYQLWRLNDFGPGRIEVLFRGLPRFDAAAPGLPATSSRPTLSPPMEPWVSWVMIALVAAALLAVTGFAIQQGGFAASTTPENPEALRNALLDEIARLDDLHALGQIDDKEWLRRRSHLKAQLIAATGKRSGAPS